MVINLNDAFGFNPFRGQELDEPADYEIKIWLGNILIDHQIISAPTLIAQQQFEQISRQLANDIRPMKLEFTYPTEVYDSNNIDSWTFTNKIWDNAHS